MDQPTSLTVPNSKMIAAEEKRIRMLAGASPLIELYELPPPVGASSVVQIVPLTLSTQTVRSWLCGGGGPGVGVAGQGSLISKLEIVYDRSSDDFGAAFAV